jgi:type I restriction enzyme S subunit
VANQVGTVVSGAFVFVSHEKAATLKANIARPGDILVVQRGSTYGKVSRIPHDAEFDRFVVCQSQMAVTVDEAACSSEFVFQALRSAAYDKFIESEVIQTGQPHINLGILKRLRVPVPPVPEQRKIAEILRTWDEAIEKLEALRAAKERRLAALRDALLFERLRVGKVRKNRPMRRIGEVTHELTARNGEGSYGRDVVMGVTNSRGIVPMREQTVADDIGRYKQLPPRAFAYNPMRINVGSIAMNEGDRTVLVSPDYVVFACNEDGMAPDYLDHVRQTRWWLHHINSGGSGSVRQRTYYDDLAALHLPLPDLNEQRAIVSVLNAAKDDVSATDQLKISLTRQKRGLMQKLLTGEWRVQIGKGIS